VDTSSLAPGDAEAALRSFPRRYRALTQPIANDERMDAMLHRRPMAGRSVFDLLVDTTRTLSLLQRALHDIEVTDNPMLHLAVVYRPAREFDTVHHGDIEDVLAELDDVSIAFADDVKRVAADQWLRTGAVVRGGSVTALDVVREAVSTAADNLHEAEITLRQVRGQ
jgi:hypothetical protein